MLLQISHYQTPIDKVADAEKWVIASAIPGVRKLGALQGYWAVYWKTGKSVVVPFWKDEAAANASSKGVATIRDEVDSLFGAKMTGVEAYDVYGQL